MGTTTVRLDDEIYERIKAESKDTETYSETIERLIGGVSLLDLAGNLSEDEATEAKQAVQNSQDVGVTKSREIGQYAEKREET
jgi:predicted CopG family antitoxin